MRCLLERTYCLTLLADSLRAANDLDRALRLCDEALAFAEATEGRSHEAETYRVRGEVVLAMGNDVARVGADFERARDIAHRQQCRSLELRAAMSAYQLHSQQGRPTELVSWFADQRSSPYVAKARALLAQ